MWLYYNWRIILLHDRAAALRITIIRMVGSCDGAEKFLRPVNLTTLSLGRLRSPKQFTGTTFP